MPYFCRNETCCCFVSGPRTNCRACGQEHDRDLPANEEPPHRSRRRNARRADPFAGLFRPAYNRNEGVRRAR